MPKIEKILFVCAGNTARSPAAEYLAKYYAKKFNVNLNFDSCGFFNAFSYMQPESKEYLDLKGIKYSDFRPKILNRALLEKQDLIITMEES
ncbi:MAG: low molecular weight phosphatase family protein, partial [Candidatus Hermodarchaeota archaeon]